MSEFWQGVRTLFAGFGWWRRRPRTMAAALVPGAVVGALMTAGIIALVAFLPALVDALTPFADDGGAFWAIAVRILIGIAVLAGGIVLAVTTFTALTLLVGEPFYDRVWRSVEEEAVGGVPEARYGLWRSARDAFSLVLRGLGVAALSVAIGFAPLVGAPLAATTGVALSGWMLADELTARALSARGLGPRRRRALRRARRARVWGFGVATHLCLMVPLAAIVAMPAAVAGSTLLAQALLDDEAARR
ncbi:EI24 domain-containing protein [Microbacterium betulae]|uniref:EI24 domain-containing protein n=1 Tax=Microbacterium betulae TaxID=2981139 RepID=A0AA97I6U8_9MICO|nr:EI24 domain-containing protein [Microbacterium sp. AB]WOF24224.1 EI24 domain-containing protein [Microbacterium sp. AB]